MDDAAERANARMHRFARIRQSWRMMAAVLAVAAIADNALACTVATPLTLVAADVGELGPRECDEGGTGWLAEGGITLWRCTLRLPEGASPEDIQPGALNEALFVMRGSEVLHRQADIPSPWGASGLVLIRADLSGDGIDEHLLAAHNTSGQGMGIERWTLSVFDASWQHLGTRTEVADWGPDAFVPRRNGPGCAVLLTFWRDMEEPGGAIIPYFVGERADVSAELPRFDTGPEGAFVSRRYDSAFARVRVKDMERSSGPQRTPKRWLAREIAQALKTTP